MPSYSSDSTRSPTTRSGCSRTRGSGCCACARDWTMEWLSNEIENIVGYPASDFIDSAVRTFASIEHPDDHDYVAERVMQSVATGRPFGLEYRLVRPDGAIC